MDRDEQERKLAERNRKLNALSGRRRSTARLGALCRVAKDPVPAQGERTSAGSARHWVPLRCGGQLRSRKRFGCNSRALVKSRELPIEQRGSPGHGQNHDQRAEYMAELRKQVVHLEQPAFG